MAANVSQIEDSNSQPPPATDSSPIDTGTQDGATQGQVAKLAAVG
jgi:hypothetical protein